MDVIIDSCCSTQCDLHISLAPGGSTSEGASRLHFIGCDCGPAMEEYDEPELLVAPDDLERDALPSDDESGPENPDPELFAGDDADADGAEEEEPRTDALAAAAVAVAGGSVAATPALPTAAAGGAAPGVPRPPGLHALMEADVSKLKVPELKMHLGCCAPGCC